MRLLGVDLGTKRIGLAVAVAGYDVATPRPALASSGTLKRDADAVARKAREEGVEKVVVGIPLLEGEETRMSSICRRFGDEIVALGVPVDFVDESLTSVEAESVMRNDDRTAAQRRRARDGEAACRILERYLSTLRMTEDEH